MQLCINIVQNIKKYIKNVFYLTENKENHGHI